MSDLSQIAAAVAVAVGAIWLPGVLIIKAAERLRSRSDSDATALRSAPHGRRG